jgi:hypothetical protein
MEFVINCPNKGCIYGKIVAERKFEDNTETVRYEICSVCNGKGRVLVKYLRSAEISDRKFENALSQGGTVKEEK